MAEKGLWIYDNTLWRPGVTLTASTQRLAVSNLLDYRPGRKWSPTGKAAEWIHVDHGADVEIDTILLYAGSFVLGSTVRVRISNNADMSSPVYDQTPEIWPPVYGFGINYGFSYGGYPNLTAFAAFTQRRLIRLGAVYTGRYLRLDFADPDNPLAYFDLGIVMAGMGWQPSRNFRFNWDTGHEDPTEHHDTDGGDVLIHAKPSHRVLSVAFGNLELDEVLAQGDDMQRIVGKKRPVLFVPFPDGSLNRIYRTSIYGLPAAWQPIRHTSALRGTIPGVTIRELR